MRSLFTFILCVVLIVSTRTIAAQITFSLPDDGAWIRMESESVREGRPPVKGTLTIKSVGRTKVDGQQCRLVEFSANREGGNLVITTVLVSEEAVAAKGFTVEQALRGWSKVGNGNVKSIPARTIRAQLSFLLPKDLRIVENMDTETLSLPKLGDVVCSRVRCKASMDDGRFEVNYEISRTNNLPFGVSRINMEITRHRRSGGKYVFTDNYSVSDFGTDAKPAFKIPSL